jgi:hypothetical protein
VRVLELFSGTGTLAGIARERGHNVLTVDLHQPADLRMDALQVTPDMITSALGGPPDMLWASPPCTGFSIAAAGRGHWSYDDQRQLRFDSDTARLGVALLRHTLALIEQLQPLTWYVENPRGLMRRMPDMHGLRRATITYCRYGAPFMKPTDVWHHSPHWRPRPMCANGDPCHLPSPRNTSRGLATLPKGIARSALPPALALDVIEASERQVASPTQHTDSADTRQRLFALGAT